MNASQVPVIDVSALMACCTDADVDAILCDATNGAVRQIVANVRAAATALGFFYIANHGVPEQEVHEFKAAMRSFFRLPSETKETILRTPENPRGYVEREFTKSKTDWKECFDFTGVHEEEFADGNNSRPEEKENRWLDEETLPGFRGDMMRHFTAMENVSRRLLKVVAVALGEEPAFFDKFFRESNSSVMRLNHYPVAPEPEKTMGVYHHTDSGALTVLLQDDQVASLQVFHRESQTWFNMPPRKETFTVNLGDLLQVWSNDKFVAPLHRVLASDTASRFSAPFFCCPAFDVQVEPIVKRGEEPHYHPFSWREFLLSRIQSDYGDVGKENEIDSFKICSDAGGENSKAA